MARLLRPVRAGAAAVAVTAVALLAACSDDSPEALVSKARADLEAQDAPSAVIRLKSVVQVTPNAAEARFLLGRALMRTGDPAAAAVELSKALDLKHPTDEVLPELALAMLQSGQSRRLVQLYGDVVLQSKPAQASLKASVASAWGLMGDKAKTDAAIAAALAAVPDYPRAVVLQARRLAGSGDFEQALRLTEGVLARDPGQYEAWQLKGEILWYAKQDPKGAEEAFRKVLAIEKSFVPAHANLFLLHMRRSDVDGARAQAEALRKVQPKHPQTILIDGHLALVSKDYKAARERAELLMRFAANAPSVLLLSGLVEARAGSPLIAQSRFEKIVQIEPSNATARRELARMYLRLGQPVRALEALQPLLGEGSTDAEANGLAGAAAVQLGDAEAAEARFARVATLQPENQRVRASIALARLGKGDVDDAFAQLEALSASSKDSYAAMALVSARMKRKEFDQALAAVDAWIARTPDDAAAHEMRGRVQLSRKDLAAARSSFERALVLDPDMLAATMGLTVIDFAEKKPEQARQRLEATIEKDPANHVARLTLAELLERTGAPMEQTRQVLRDAVKAAPAQSAPRLALIDFLMRKKQVNEALELAQAGTAALPNDLDMLYALGRALELKGDLQQALSTYRRIIGIEPNRVRAHMRMAEIFKTQGNRGAAVATLRRVLEVDPDFSIASLALVDVLTADKRGKEAIEVARDQQQRAPTSRGGYVLEAAIHEKAKNPTGAAAAFRRGLQQIPDDATLALNLYRTLGGSGQHAEAERLAQDWLRRHPDDPGMHYIVAVSAIQRAELARAEVGLRRTLELQPNHALAMNDLAWVLLEQGKPGALPLARRAVELQPRAPRIMDTLALAMAAEGDLAGALKLQKEAVELDPGSMELRFTLAKIAVRAGDAALARSELDRLSGLGTRFKYHGEVAALRSKL